MTIKDITGTVIDQHYQIISCIGHGATSSVYLAKDLQIGATWAVKVIDKKNEIQREDYNRQYDEAKLLSKLSHPMFPRVLPTIYDEDDYFLIVMDYISGISLKDRIKQPFSLQQIIEWLKQLCDGIDYLHQQGYIYCDLKPENILVENNQLKIIDLGSCVRNGDNHSLRSGNKAFSAPEYRNQSSVPAGEYTDNYGIGRIGQYLIQKSGVTSVPDMLIQILKRCTIQNYQKRYLKTTDILHDLRICEKNLDPTATYRTRFGLFLACVLLSIVSFTVGIVSYLGLKADYTSEYSNYVNQGIRYEQSGDYESAVEAYLNAATRNPSDDEIYDKIFELMSPDTSDNIKEENKLLLDAFRDRTETQYLNDNLRLNLAELCIEQNTPVYIDYANTLLKGLKGDRAEVLKEIISNDSDYDQVIGHLEQLVDASENDEDKLNYLYLYVNVLAQQEVLNSTSLDWIEQRLDTIDISVLENSTETIQIYKIIANNLSQSLTNKSTAEKALQWWKRLEHYESSFSKSDFIAEGNAYEVMENYNQALNYYQKAINEDTTDLSTYISAVDAALAAGNKDIAGQLWQQIVSLQKQQENQLSANVMNQLNALKTELQMQGII